MEISTNPDNQETSNDSIYVLTPSARKKLNAIAQAIAWHMEDEREKSGNPVPVSGYSGRKSK
jgi:hypothetical protein